MGEEEGGGSLDVTGMQGEVEALQNHIHRVRPYLVLVRGWL